MRANLDYINASNDLSKIVGKKPFSKSNINIMTANTYFTPQMFPTKYPASYTYVKKIARVATE